MQSMASRLMPLVIRLRGSKRRYRSADATLDRIARLAAKPAPSTPPRGLHRRVGIARRTSGRWTVYELSPRRRPTGRLALFLHGGSYVYQIQRQHWTLVADLADRSGATIVVPIFGLAPAETATTIVDGVADLAEELMARAQAEPIAILGDSSGGGMALAVAMLLRDRGAPPSELVLICPWLDIGSTDPEIARIDPSDPWLAVPGSRAAGGLYRGPLAEDDPRVSPLHGDLRSLGGITMFSGTRDILNADAHRLAERARQLGIPLDFHEAPAMIHDYPLLPIAEARRAREIIARILKR